MPNFTSKTIKEIHDDIVTRYEVLKRKYGSNATLLEKSIVNCLAWSFAGVAYTFYPYALWIYKQCFPQSCGLPALKMWGFIADEAYKSGQKALIRIKLINVSAAYLSGQTVYKELTSGLTYKTISQATVEDGVIYATAECTKAGLIGNLESGCELYITNPYAGIPEKAEVISIVTQGTEDEYIETYRQRVLNKFRNKSQCGSPRDYHTWGTSVPGIIDILPYIFEEGTITLFPVAEGSGKDRTPSGELSPNPFPKWENGQFKELEGTGQMLAIAEAICGNEKGAHNRRPVMAKVDLRNSADYTPFAVEINGLENTAHCELIKNIIINILDKKRPHIVVLSYPVRNAKINKEELSAACISSMGGDVFTSFILKNKTGNVINEAILDVGQLPYLSKLTINGTVYYEEKS